MTQSSERDSGRAGSVAGEGASVDGGAASIGPLRVRVRRLLRDFELDVDLVVDRWPLVLLGRSGAGKTQLLRILAGLEPSARGRIELDGEVWLDERTQVPTHRRSIGFCVQEAELFPHLSVLDNVVYPLRFRGAIPRRDRAELARRWLAQLGVEHLAASSPSSISGGERGRIALARALVARPRLLLADEPFAALDPVQRRELGREVAEGALRGERVVWVTHDPAEAELLSQDGLRIQVEKGRIVSGQAPSR